MVRKQEVTVQSRKSDHRRVSDLEAEILGFSSAKERGAIELLLNVVSGSGQVPLGSVREKGCLDVDRKCANDRAKRGVHRASSMSAGPHWTCALAEMENELDKRPRRKVREGDPSAHSRWSLVLAGHPGGNACVHPNR